MSEKAEHNYLVLHCWSYVVCFLTLVCVCVSYWRLAIHKRKLHQAMLVGGFGRGLFVTGACKDFFNAF